MLTSFLICSDFSQAERDALLLIMEKFELFTLLKSSSSTSTSTSISSNVYLVPELLQEERIEGAQFTGKFANNPLQTVEWLYVIEFVPYGVVSRLICRIQPDCDVLRPWRYGFKALLTKPLGDVQVLVEFFPSKSHSSLFFKNYLMKIISLKIID